jgi:hypothetical protein
VAHLGGGVVGEGHHGAPDDQRPGDEPQAAQGALDGVLEEQPDDADRQRAQDHRPAEAVVGVVAPGLVEHALEPGRDDPDEVLAQEDHRGDDRAGLDDRGERGDVRVVDPVAEQLLQDGQMSCAGDGQELGEALHRTQQNCFKNVQPDLVP